MIFDQHKNLVDIENSLKTLRLDMKSTLTTHNLIEKGFFVDSSKSYAIQLVDFALYYIRKFEEDKIGKRVSPVHKEVFPIIEDITKSLDTHKKALDILEWIRENRV